MESLRAVGSTRFYDTEAIGCQSLLVVHLDEREVRRGAGHYEVERTGFEIGPALVYHLDVLREAQVDDRPICRRCVCSSQGDA